MNCERDKRTYMMYCQKRTYRARTVLSAMTLGAHARNQWERGGRVPRACRCACAILSVRKLATLIPMRPKVAVLLLFIGMQLIATDCTDRVIAK